MSQCRGALRGKRGNARRATGDCLLPADRRKLRSELETGTQVRMPARRKPPQRSKPPHVASKPPRAGVGPARVSYDEALAGRIRRLLARKPGIAEKRMFGGLAFLLDGRMTVGLWKDSLIARLGDDQAAVALRQPGVRQFDVTGRPMRGWVMIDAAELADDVELDDWIGQSLRYVRTLPEK